jgi:hypothetical protein
MVMSNSAKVPYGTPERGKELASRAPKGRLCAAPGCATVLSTYNRSQTCFLHSSPSFGSPLQRG